MRVKVHDEIDGVHASTLEAGEKLYQLIGPAIARGEEVVMDFEGVKHFSPSFFNWGIGRFIEDDHDGKLSQLLRYENLPPLGWSSLEMVIEYATRRRENPRWGMGIDAAIRKRAAEAWE